MTVHFWGVRGSIPTPLTPEQIQSKIIAAIERITPKDLESQDARTRFLAMLPEWLFGTVGGNSPCVEVTSSSGTKFILDAGSGLRELSVHGEPPKDFHYHLFMSHFHWDHIQGIPFWGAAFNPKAVIEVYSAFPDAERVLSKQNDLPYFPENCRWNRLKNRFRFHVLKNMESIFIGTTKITMKKMRRPGNSYSYIFEENGKKFVYATDVELLDIDLDIKNERNNIFKDADVVIIDSQYNIDDAEAKKNWGHNVYYRAVDFATTYNTKRLFLFHHEPTYSDQQIYAMLQAARWYAESSENSKLQIDIAIEGQDVEF